MSCYLILLEVSLFYFEIENVGLEPLLCVPNAACCLNTSFSIKLLQRESNPRLRRDSPVYWPLYDEAISSCGPANPGPHHTLYRIVFSRT